MIDLDGDTVTVKGQLESQEQREKVILVLGNVEGVATVDDRLTVVVSAPEAIFYQVQRGHPLQRWQRNTTATR